MSAYESPAWVGFFLCLALALIAPSGTRAEDRQPGVFQGGDAPPAPAPDEPSPGGALLSWLMGENKEGIHTWPEANLRYELGFGWAPKPNASAAGAVRAHRHLRDGQTVLLSFIPLAKGETLSPEEVIDALDPGRGLVNLKPVVAANRAKEWGVKVFDGELDQGGQAKTAVRLGRWFHRGGIYEMVVLTVNGESAAEEFDRLLAGLSWMEPEKEVRVQPLDELRRAGAGMRVPCAGALLTPIPPTLPGATAGIRISSRVEILALAINGIDLAPRERMAAFVESCFPLLGDQYELKETQWAGLPAWVAKPKEPATRTGKRGQKWRLTGVEREGFLCLAFEFWTDAFKGAGDTLAKLVAGAEFTPPTGEAAPPLDPQAREMVGLIYNDMGLKAYSAGRLQAAANAFSRAYEDRPKDSTIVANLANAMLEQGRVREGLEFIERRANKVEQTKDIRRLHALMLAKAERFEEADARFARLFEEGHREEDDLLQWIEVLQQLERHERAIEVAAETHRRNGQLLWQRVLANCLWTAGRMEEARDHFRKLAGELENDAGFAADHATLLVEMGEHKAALDLVEAFEKGREAPAAMLFSKGMAQSGLGWFKEAVETFSRLNERAPGNQTVGEALARAQAMLGRGTLEGYRDDLEPVPMPPDIARRAAAAADEVPVAEAFPGEGWVALYDVRVWEWRQGAEARVTDHRRIRVLDSAGVAAFATIHLPFKPHFERVKIHRLVVSDAEGRELAVFRKEDLYVRDREGEVADGAKVLCLPVPALKEGAVIELVTTKRLLGTADRFPLAAEAIPEGGALAYGAVVFTGDLGQLRFDHAGPITPVAGDGWQAFEAVRVSRLRAAAELPPGDRWGRLCWAVDRRRTWESETGDYLAEIRNCLDDDGFADEVVRDLELADKPPQEVIRAVVRWLNRKFQYQGLAFGPRARIPAKGALTLGRGFGDCKDLSVLVRAVLRKAGVPAELALVATSGVLREDLPDLDQFDHMVVFLPAQGGAILDPTVRHFNTPEALPAQFAGSRALLVEGATPRFVTMREGNPAPRVVEIEREVRVDEVSGDAAVRETAVFSPARGAVMRYVFSATAAAEHVRTMEALLRRKEPGIEVQRAAFRGLDDPFEPLRLELEYRVPGAFHAADGELSGAIPAPLERLMAESEPERDRNIGILVRCAESCSIRSRIRLPDGYAWQPPAQTKRTTAEPGALEGAAEWRLEADAVTLVGTLRTEPCEGDADLARRIHLANLATFRLWGERLRFAEKRE